MKCSFPALLVLTFLSSSPAAFTQGTEAEPNHPCVSAQELGEVGLPYMVSGALDAVLSGICSVFKKG